MGFTWQGRVMHWHGPTPLPMLPHLRFAVTGRVNSTKNRVYPHNDAMPVIYSDDTVTDAYRLLVCNLAYPAQAAPFAQFCVQDMDAIIQ